jgi:adenylate cyclase
VKQEGILGNRPAATIIFSTVVCLAVAGAGRFDFVEIVELNGFDALIHLKGEPKPAESIVFVDISDATEARIKEWPLPRHRLATAVRTIAGGGAELIGLDVELADERTHAPDQDRELAAALAEAGNVVVPSVVTERGVITEPLPLFRDAALDVGSVNLYLDADGAIRGVPLAVTVPGASRLGFATVLATNHVGTPLQKVRPGRYRIGPREISAREREGAAPAIVIARWTKPGRRVEMHDLLEPGFDAAVFKDKIVIVGSSSKSRKDLYETPLYRRNGHVSGPEIHAAGLIALLEGRTVRPLGGVVLFLINLAAALLAMTFLIRGRLAWTVPAFIVLLAGIVGLASWLLWRYDIWLRFVSSGLGLMLILAAALGYRFLQESEHEREMRRLFGQYVSSDVLQEVLRHPEGIIEGQDRVASILFADIRGFTSTSAGKPPKDVIAWVNDYFAAMSEVIDRNGGFLNKFIGDGLMVVFGAPVSDGEQQDAERAVRTALQMLERLEKLNADNAARSAEGLWRPPVYIGLGVHTGPVAAGNVGSPQRMEYSVIGETVNLAARLESATRKFDGIDLVISPSTERLVRERFVTEALGLADAKGFDEQVQVYTVRSERSAPIGGAVS